MIDEKYVGVSILLHFESDEDLLRWNSSTVRLSKIEAAKKLGLFADRRVGIKDKAVPFVQITRFESSACKSPRVLPPPKWKLWLVIWGCVATTSLAASEAAVARGLRHGGWLEYEPALFIQLLLTVTLIIFAYSPLLISINIYGFGLAAWLKLPRLKVSTKPGKRYKPPNHTRTCSLLRAALRTHCLHGQDTASEFLLLVFSCGWCGVLAASSTYE